MAPGSIDRGFTLVELMSVLVIVGVLALALVPRFAAVDVFAERGFYEEALAATRYARQLAVASGCSIQVQFDAANDRVSVARWPAGGDCTVRAGAPVAVARPGGGDYVATAPAGVDVVTDLNFFFDRVGRPRDASGALITNAASLVVAIGTRQLQVVPETGLVLGG